VAASLWQSPVVADRSCDYHRQDEAALHAPSLSVDVSLMQMQMQMQKTN
jgi:hypothetical protein